MSTLSRIIMMLYGGLLATLLILLIYIEIRTRIAQRNLDKLLAIWDARRNDEDLGS